MRSLDVEFAVGIAILVLLLALLVTSAWAIGARPKPFLLIVSAVAAVVLGWQAWAHIQGHLWCQRVLSARRLYELDVSGMGERTVRIDTLPGIDGLQVRAVSNDGSGSTPSDWVWIGLRARDGSGPVRVLLTSNSGLIDLDSEEGFG